MVVRHNPLRGLASEGMSNEIWKLVCLQKHTRARVTSEPDVLEGKERTKVAGKFHTLTDRILLILNTASLNKGQRKISGRL